MLPALVEPEVSLPEPVVPLPLVVEPVVLPVLPVVLPVLLPEDWAKANGAAPSIPTRTIFFMNPFIITLQKDGPIRRGPPEVGDNGWA